MANIKPLWLSGKLLQGSVPTTALECTPSDCINKEEPRLRQLGD